MRGRTGMMVGEEEITGGHVGGYENSFLQNFYPQPGPGAYSNGYRAGIADAVYDHDNNLAYNPVGQCLPCHSEVYWDGFHHGYDTQWNSYQVQTQNTVPSIQAVVLIMIS
jgi:hypothetical protein